MQRKELTILIKNNTGATVPVQLFKFPTPGYENATATYTWNVTAESYLNKDRISIEYKNVNADDFNTSIIEGSFQSVSEVVNALNGLGIGVFWSFEQGGLTYIRTQNRIITYGQLDIYRIGNAPPVFINPATTTYYMSNAATIHIAGWASDVDGDSLIITEQDLPSFCTLIQYDYAGVRVFDITCSPGSSINNGTYDFTLFASDGMVTVSKNYQLVVDNTTRGVLTRPLNPDPISLVVGDTNLITYPITPTSGVAFQSTRAVDPNLILPGWAVSNLGNEIEVEPAFLSGNTGVGILFMVYGSIVNRASDTFLMKVEVIDAPL